jgi:hypothetical protein
VISALVAASLAATCDDAYCRQTVVKTDPTTTPLQWPGNTRIVWRASSRGDTEIPGDAEFTGFANAFDTWERLLESCSSLRFEHGPNTDRRDVGWSATEVDPQNLLVFRETACADVVPAGTTCTGNGDCANLYDCWEYKNTALAVTTTSYHPRLGTIYDADIEFNLPSFIFTAVDSPVCPTNACNVNCVCTDVQNATTHEIGHLLGLDHTTRPTSIMFARSEAGDLSKRTIDPGTASFVCDVYPSTGLLRVPEADGKLKPVACASAPLLLVGLLMRRRRWVREVER